MSWFKVDDSFHGHPKVLSIPRRDRLAAIGLWATAGSWCAQHLTDGRFGRHMIEEFGGAEKHATALVRVGLWEENADGSLSFHDWIDWQPTREHVLERRAAEAKRKQDWRDRKREKATRPQSVPAGQERDTGGTDAGTDAGVRDSSALPDPTRPDPTVVPNGTTNTTAPRKRGTRIADDFTADDDMRQWAAECTPGLDVDAATAEFVDYWRAVPGTKGTKLDWTATWRNRMREVHGRRRHLRPVADEDRAPSFWDRKIEPRR